MGLFSGFSGRPSQEENIERAEAFIGEVKNKARQSPSKALKMLRKGAHKHSQALGMGGKVHHAFRELALELLATQFDTSPSRLPTVKVVPWDTWQHPQLKDLQSEAATTDKDILYCPTERKRANPFSEIEALLSLATDPELVMVVINSENMLFRKPFLLEAAATLDPTLEEIGPELADYAANSGKKIRFL